MTKSPWKTSDFLVLNTGVSKVFPSPLLHPCHAGLREREAPKGFLRGTTSLLTFCCQFPPQLLTRCPHCHPCLHPLITPLAQPGPASFPDLSVACLRGDEFLGTVLSTTTWTSQGQPSSSTSMMMYPFLEACGPPGAPEREQVQVPSRCPLFN